VFANLIFQIQCQSFYDFKTKQVKLKVTILGSGTSLGVPVIGCNCRVCSSKNEKDKRLRTSALIQIEDVNILIDAGPDFRGQMLKSNTHHLEAILLTHEHRDHTAGLDDVRAFNWINGSPVNVYAESNVLDSLRQMFFYAFAESKYPGVPEFLVHEIGEDVFFINNIKVTPIRGVHSKLPVLGFRIGAFTYITDMNYIAPNQIEKIAGSKVIVINGLRHEYHHSHFNLQQALDLIRIWKPKQAYITHISHQLGLHEEVNKTLPEGVELAYDGLCFQVS
jgi:phosphoribosyl 1,2-cyclic phosphate phosphodiesterase